MQNITVDIDVHTYTTREADPDDGWSRDSTAASLNVTGIRRSEAKGYRDITVPFEVKPGQHYFLVWADYNTGDSFGNDDNQYEFIDLFADFDKAKACQKAAEDSNGYGMKHIRGDGTEMETHVPWHGYFESLNGINVDVVVCKA